MSLDSDVESDHYWVIGFARGTMNAFVENILKIPHLSTNHATQQLVADIGELEFQIKTSSFKMICPNFLFIKPDMSNSFIIQNII